MITEQIREFLLQSNAIEEEFSATAYEDAEKCWKSIMANKRPLNTKKIEALHGILMNRIYPHIAGHYRRCNVMVGRRLCPDFVHLPGMMRDWIKGHSHAKTEAAIKEAHVAFEKIHPFEDGNGRIGRIIMNWQRAQAKLPILIIHAGKEQMEYYKWFK